jgi:hypothetical protein
MLKASLYQPYINIWENKLCRGLVTALYKMPRNEKLSLELWKMIGFCAVPYLPESKTTLIYDDSPYEKRLSR